MHNESNTQDENLPGRVSRKRRRVKLPRYSHLNKQAIAHFDNFIESTSPLRLSHSLRDLFLLHLSYESAAAMRSPTSCTNSPPICISSSAS